MSPAASWWGGKSCQVSHVSARAFAGINTFFGRAAALIGATNNVANIQKIMTRIGEQTRTSIVSRG